MSSWMAPPRFCALSPETGSHFDVDIKDNELPESTYSVNSPEELSSRVSPLP